MCSYKEGADPKRGPSVFYGDGKRKHNMLAKRMMYHKERSKKADKFGLVPTKSVLPCLSPLMLVLVALLSSVWCVGSLLLWIGWSLYIIPCIADAPKCRTYEGHLQPHEFDASKKQIPQGEALVLFHYVSRSFQDFRERKLSRCEPPLSVKPLLFFLLELA